MNCDCDCDFIVRRGARAGRALGACRPRGSEFRPESPESTPAAGRMAGRVPIWPSGLTRARALGRARESIRPRAADDPGAPLLRNRSLALATCTASCALGSGLTPRSELTSLLL